MEPVCIGPSRLTFFFFFKQQENSEHCQSLNESLHIQWENQRILKTTLVLCSKEKRVYTSFLCQ